MRNIRYDCPIAAPGKAVFEAVNRIGCEPKRARRKRPRLDEEERSPVCQGTGAAECGGD
jgi:hypothetical protein